VFRSPGSLRSTTASQRATVRIDSCDDAQIVSKRLTIGGFINYDFAAEHYADFLREVGAGVTAGRIRYREDIVDGLENAPGAFIGMLEGRNFGKLILRVAA
jgi:NADPH-dependent curcumin reductase CurA